MDIKVSNVNLLKGIYYVLGNSTERCIDKFY